MKTRYACLLAALCFPIVSWSEDAVLFKASALKENQWGVEKAVLKIAPDLITVQEKSTEARRIGSAYCKPLLPFLPGGRLSVSVKRVFGMYSLQLLVFSKGRHSGTVNLITDAPVAGTRQFDLDQYKLSGQVDSFLLKLWVAGWEGATIELKDIEYTAPLPKESAVFDDSFRKADEWESENLRLKPRVGGIETVLAAGKTGGSLVCPEMLTRNDDAVVLLSVDKVAGGSVSAQLAFFDGAGQYLSSTNLICEVGNGWHAARLSVVGWPETASSFRIKTWLGGEPGAKAVFKRLMLVSP